MEIEVLVPVITLGIACLGGIFGIIIAIVRGDMKKFIVEQMELAERNNMTGAEKLAFVLQAVKTKYKVLELVLNVKKFIEYVISISKNINYK